MVGRRFRSPSLTVDAVWIAGDRVLLVRRGRAPFRGRWAFPGGFVELGETVEEAVVRELHEETGLRPAKVRLMGVYSRPGRDPRGPTVTIAYRMAGRPAPPMGASDAREARWVDIAKARGLAFDHDEILRDALKTRRRGIEGPGPVAGRSPNVPISLVRNGCTRRRSRASVEPRRGHRWVARWGEHR